MNHNNKRSIIIGAILGLVFSVVLYFTQDIEPMIYFSVAPYYVNSLTFRSDGFINIITFFYFIIIFSLSGYLCSSNIARKFKLLTVIVIVILHCVLLRLGGNAILDDLPKAIVNALSADSK